MRSRSWVNPRQYILGPTNFESFGKNYHEKVTAVNEPDKRQYSPSR